jgi:hypothetical protein
MVRPSPAELGLVVGLAALPAFALEALKAAARRGFLPGENR